MRISRQGDFLQADFFENVGGLNNTDSPFIVSPNQATSGQNYDYVRTGAIQKRLGHTLLNSSADSQLTTMGLGLHLTSADVRTIIRAAGTKFQNFNIGAESFTNLTEDTAAAGSDFFSSSSTQTVKFNQFNTTDANLLIANGGGLTIPYAVTSSTKVTKLGTDAPTGSIGLSQSAGSGTFPSTSVFRYAVAVKKASTGAISNVALEDSITLSSTTNEVTINLSSVTVDTTKYDQFWIYRSAAGGSEGFTTGDLIAKIASTSTSYDDTGSSLSTSENVPRAGNTSLDNSPLPSGTYNSGTVFKRRYVTAKGSTVYLSDLNKPESFPTTNVITIPSGGNITALGVISFNTPTTSGTDEFLVIWKENETWLITGDSVSDYSLQFIDNVGCINQTSVVNANGFIYWMDARGIYLWDGSGKPIYCSRLIENYFGRDGDLNQAQLASTWAVFYKKQNMVIWYTSDTISGKQKFAFKLDLRLTLPSVQGSLTGRIMPGVFTVDTSGIALYGGANFKPPNENEEFLIAGDASGKMYRLYSSNSDNSTGIDFEYETSFLDMGTPGIAKRFHKVIAWVQKIDAFDLNLDYWSAYKTGEDNKTTNTATVDANSADTALWDVGEWDVAFWDDYGAELTPLVFNLTNSGGNSEGDCLKIRFRQGEVDEPVVINGFSILYSEIGLRK